MLIILPIFTQNQPYQKNLTSRSNMECEMTDNKINASTYILKSLYFHINILRQLGNLVRLHSNFQNYKMKGMSL